MKSVDSWFKNRKITSRLQRIGGSQMIRFVTKKCIKQSIPKGCGGRHPEFERWVEFPPLPNWQFVRGDNKCYVISWLQGHAAIKIPSYENLIKSTTIHTTCLHVTCCNGLAWSGTDYIPVCKEVDLKQSKH